MPIYCMNCGVSLPDGVAFCDACGTPVRGQHTSVSAAQAPAPAPAQAPVYTSSVSSSGAASAGSVVCPVCGASALPGEAFCDNCGASLLPAGSYQPSAPAASPAGAAPQSVPHVPPASYAPPQRTASLVITSPAPPATLLVPDRPELIVGRSDPQSNSYPDVDLGPYGGLDLGVSRRHFRLTRTGDQFYIEDLNAVNGTVINGQRIPPNTLHPLRNGDRIALGKMEMTFELS